VTALYLTTKEQVGPAPGVRMLKPRGADGLPEWWSIDFSPDSTALAGGVLLSVPNRNDARHGGIYLGEDFASPLPTVLAGRLANAFGVTLESADAGLGAVLLELLVLHADDARSDRWNRLRPTNGRYDVWLGERVASLLRVSGGAVYLATETFNTANSSTLGPVHTWAEYGLADWTVSSNVAILNTTIANECVAIAATDLPSSDNYTTAVITQATNINSGAGGPLCRGSSSAATGYGCRKEYSGNPKGIIALKVVNGVYTVISTAGSATWALGTGYTLRISANGSTITATNAQLSLSTTVTDTAITSGTRMGIQGWVQTGATRVTYDNVAAGTLEAFPYPTKGRNARGSQALLVRGRF